MRTSPIQVHCGFADSTSSHTALLPVQAAHELFGMGRENIDLTFGGVTIGTAVVATLLGGWALDWVGSSIKNAMLLNGTFSPPLASRSMSSFLAAIV